MALPFKTPSQRGSAWFSVGLASSFLNITESGGITLSEQQPCGTTVKAGCKVFLAPTPDEEVEEVRLPSNQVVSPGRQGEQVLVFQYKGKLHAIDHKCPHSSFPLSNGVPFDVEDFGIALSAGINCPKHGWSFDLFSGNADRGNYKLKLWEVQLRPIASTRDGGEDQEVWVRKRQRMG